MGLPLDLAAWLCYIGFGVFTISCERGSCDAVAAALCLRDVCSV